LLYYGFALLDNPYDVFYVFPDDAAVKLGDNQWLNESNEWKREAVDEWGWAPCFSIGANGEINGRRQ
jgi:hypothetical protein